MDPKQCFHRHFQESVEVLQDQVAQLESVFAVAGERQEAVDYVLAAIAKLQNEVADAADYTPSYDRRQYAETIKSLQDELSDTIARVTPKYRFQFRRSLADAHVDMGAPENDPRLKPGSLARNPHPARPEPPGHAVEDDDVLPDLPQSPTTIRDYNKELSQSGTSGIRKPSFSAANTIGISGQNGLHIILPSSAARANASGSLTDLRDCIVDMSVPTAQGKPFAGLSLRSISNSLIIAGKVSGPVHITDVSDSILVAAARQVRIHNCHNVDVYLHCSSHPIIEDCTEMRFAPLPKCYVGALRLLLALVFRTAGADVKGRRPRLNQRRRTSGIRWTTSSGSRQAIAQTGPSCLPPRCCLTRYGPRRFQASRGQAWARL